MTARASSSHPLIFVTVGTDHHPFDRVIAWVDAWIAGNRGSQDRWFVQTGTSRPPRLAEWSAYLPFDRVRELMSDASAIICHGGPATVVDCFRYGMKPIVVPRRSHLGEHVDDHQVSFSRWMAKRGHILVADTKDQFDTLLERALAGDESFVASDALFGAARAAERFERLVNELLARPQPPVVSRAGSRSGGAVRSSP